MEVSVIKPTRSTISQIYFILEQHSTFRTVFPFIIRSLRLYIQHQVYVIQVMWLLASKQPHNLYGMMLYVESWTPDDGRKDHPKYVEWYSINSKNCASSWFYYRYAYWSTCLVPVILVRFYWAWIFLDRISKKYKIPSVQWEPSCFMRTDRQTSGS